MKRIQRGPVRGISLKLQVRSGSSGQHYLQGHQRSRGLRLGKAPGGRSIMLSWRWWRRVLTGGTDSWVHDALRRKAGRQGQGSGATRGLRL